MNRIATLRRWGGMILLFVSLAVHAATSKDLQVAGELLATGQYAAAEAQLDRIIREGVNEALVGDVLTDNAQMLRAIARAAQGRLDAAAEDVAALGKPRSSLTASESAVLLDALVRLRRGDRAGALAAYDRGVQMSAEGMGSGMRRASAFAQRAWAKLCFGDFDGARADFEAAAASDGTMMFVDGLILQKPFWRAVIDEALPLFSSGRTQEGLERVDAIAARLDLLGKLRSEGRGGGLSEISSAKSILWYEMHSGVVALRAKLADEARSRAEAARRQRLAEAQQALIDNDPRRAFDAYVAAFREAQDAEGRDRAVAGLATVLKLLPQKPPMPEEVRRLVVKAGVLADEKDYAGAIRLYWQAYHQAPWLAQLYHDRALLLGRMARTPNDYEMAMREMRRFLTLAPDSPDARAAQDTIYEWEARRERARDALPEIRPQARGVSATAAGSDDCFIATAAYGSPLEPHVASLRAFRDRHLLTNAAGRWLVARYYEYSPPLAEIIREREGLRAVVRALLAPVVFAVERPAAALAILIAAIFGGMAWRCRRA